MINRESQEQYAHVCMHAHTHTHTCRLAHTHTHKHTHTHTHLQTCTHTLTNLRAHIHIVFHTHWAQNYKQFFFKVPRRKHLGTANNQTFIATLSSCVSSFDQMTVSCHEFWLRHKCLMIPRLPLDSAYGLNPSTVFNKVQDTEQDECGGHACHTKYTYKHSLLCQHFQADSQTRPQSHVMCLTTQNLNIYNSL